MAGKSAVRVVRLTAPNEDLLRLLEEYYEAADVVRRDTPESLRDIFREPSSGAWLAELQGEAVGCVVLRNLPSFSLSGECKRLFVRPSARGHGIGDKLMDALEKFAQDRGLQWVYLDSYSALKTAIALYRRRGYTPCERYNDNPQATVFLRKHLSGSEHRMQESSA